jgi:hypothetical protein
MFVYLFAIFSLAALCSVWAMFQIWVGKYHPDSAALKSGCSACSCCADDKSKFQTCGEINTPQVVVNYTKN